MPVLLMPLTTVGLVMENTLENLCQTAQVSLMKCLSSQLQVYTNHVSTRTELEALPGLHAMVTHLLNVAGPTGAGHDVEIREHAPLD